jgi:phosphoglycolate phosphatase-like HAD superfamily hydrolase
MKKSRVFTAAIFVALALALSGCATRQSANIDEMSLWSDSAPAKQALKTFIASATNPASADFIAPEERVAVFDLDGTLFLETDPTYFDWTLFTHRVLDDANFRPLATAEQIAIAKDLREKNKLPGISEHTQNVAAQIYGGMTLARFRDYVRAFMRENQPGFTNLKRGEAFYRPMIEVVRMLVNKGFTVYVVSGADRFIARALSEEMLPLPSRQIIGSDSGVVASGQGSKAPLGYVFATSDGLTLNGKNVVKNLQMNKTTAIVREIGVTPVLAFGNTMSDASMLNYTLSNKKHKTLAFMLLCDDLEREYGNLERAKDARAQAQKYGWIPVSMKNDWKTIYGENVVKTRQK